MTKARQPGREGDTMPDGGTVLLVESDHAESERLGRALENGGYEVISCPGPTAPDYTCIGGREGYCPLVERADVVVIDPWLAGDEYGVGTPADVLVELYANRGRTVILLGSAGWLDPFTGGHVVSLGDRADPAEVLAAVRSAPEADGFVLRGP
jgi:hypothetical protein